MGQLEEYKMAELWPQRSSEITVLIHCRDRAKQMERALRSVQWADRRIVLIDDRTTDNLEQVCHDYKAETEKFTWCDDFSYPKNILTQKVPYGQWCFVIGSDFECTPEAAKSIEEFVRDPLNCLAKFNVYEYCEDPTRARKRNRVLLWRSHPEIYWERLAHEEMKMSAFRLTYIGIAFMKEWAIPSLGDIIHYGDFENSKEELDRKRKYYQVLWERDKIRAEANMKGLYGLLYSLLPKLESVADVKKFMDASMHPGFKVSEYGAIHTEDKIITAMVENKVPTDTVILDKDYD